MSDLNDLSDDQQQNINLFMEISGSDYDTAVQMLTATNYDLQQAMNLHLERINEPAETNDISPEDEVAAASTSSSLNPNLPIDDGEDDVRAPILPKREQLIMPNEDNFRPYRKRRSVVARSACPLRNFELEGRMQEERLNAAVLGSFADDGNEAVAFGAVANTSNTTPKQPLGFSTVTTQAALQAKIIVNAQAAVNVPAQAPPSRLSELFRPPVDINFCGSFQAARDFAKDQNRWLIVNVQDMASFGCQVLNRDIWSSEQLRKIIKKYFVFWQVATDNSDGHRFQVFYSVNSYPYVGIIDPRTGEEKLSHKHGFRLTLPEFVLELREYLKDNTPFPDADTNDITPAMIDKCDCFKNCIASNSHSEVPSAKRKRMEPSSLSEQEQIALAISNSLRAASNDDDNHDDDSLDNVDEDSDYEDFDDESSSQSFAKGPSSQATSEHSNSNIGASKSEIVECDTNNIGSTTDIADSYENYLGDESDPKARIQLRLPNGDRHIVEWPCSARLKALKLYLPFKYPELTADNEYKVICPFVGGPSNNVLEMDEVLTLKQANLFPSVILHLRNDD